MKEFKLLFCSFHRLPLDSICLFPFFGHVHLKARSWWALTRVYGCVSNATWTWNISTIPSVLHASWKSVLSPHATSWKRKLCLLSLPIICFFSGMSCKWDHTASGLFCLGPFHLLPCCCALFLASLHCWLMLLNYMDGCWMLIQSLSNLGLVFICLLWAIIQGLGRACFLLLGEISGVEFHF